MDEGGCYDCGMAYGSDGWLDAVIPTEVWAMITPSEHHEGGILCISCMTRRLVRLGLDYVEITIVSGPYICISLGEFDITKVGAFNKIDDELQGR